MAESRGLGDVYKRQAYYYQRGAIANSLQFDKQWKEAVKLLGNIDEYKKILTPAPNKK